MRSILFTLAGAVCVWAQAAHPPSLTLDGARRVIAAGVAEAKKNQATGVFAVVDRGGNLLAVERLDGTFAAGANIAIGKARTAALFQRPTKFFEDVINKGRTAMTALPDFTPLQGGVPVLIGGEIAGAVGVSGASSAQQDEEFALAAARGVSETAPVVHYERSRVADAFAKGAVLFDASAKYMVHASRREKPGVAEIHLEDADIIHVLEGQATLVTGGKVPEAKPVADGELRGPAIEGGEVRQLSQGDVIVIPAGVPHWFREVTNPFLYYVVKAR